MKISNLEIRITKNDNNKFYSKIKYMNKIDITQVLEYKANTWTKCQTDIYGVAYKDLFFILALANLRKNPLKGGCKIYWHTKHRENIFVLKDKVYGERIY